MPQSSPAAATCCPDGPLRSGPARPLHARQPHRHGAADALARRRRGRAGRAAGHLLRPARLGRPHRLRSDQHQRAGQGLHPHARHLVARAGRRLEADDQGGARQGRPHLPAALARRARLASRPAAGRRAARGAERRARRRTAGLHLRRLQAARHAARAGDRRDPRHRRRLRARARSAPRMPASTASRSTPPTATCCSSSCPTRPTSAPTSTAARSRTARASSSRWSRR